MVRFRSIAYLIALPMAASSCMLLSGRCLYELRNVVAEGTLLENNLTIAAAHMVESEQRDYQPDKVQLADIRRGPQGTRDEDHVTGRSFSQVRIPDQRQLPTRLEQWIRPAKRRGKSERLLGSAVGPERDGCDLNRPAITIDRYASAAEYPEL